MEFRGGHPHLMSLNLILLQAGPVVQACARHILHLNLFL